MGHAALVLIWMTFIATKLTKFKFINVHLALSINAKMVDYVKWLMNSITNVSAAKSTMVTIVSFKTPVKTMQHTWPLKMISNVIVNLVTLENAVK